MEHTTRIMYYHKREKNMERYRIYLDCCCFNRPFDDQSDARVRLESEAVLTIIDKCEMGTWRFLKSDVLFDEISAITAPLRKHRILTLYAVAAEDVPLNDAIVSRAKELTAYNIKPYDALHLASAEYARADVFLTVDKKLVNQSQRAGLTVKVYNVAAWLMEVL